MKQTIGIFLVVLTSIPQLLLADMGRMNQAFPGFSSPFIGHPSHLNVPKQNFRPSMRQHPDYRQRVHAPRWNSRPSMMPARQAMRPMRPPMPAMQQRPLYPQRAQAPRWNSRPPMMPTRQVMRPPMPAMQQRPAYPQRAQAPRWNSRPPMMPTYNRWSQGQSLKPRVNYRTVSYPALTQRYRNIRHTWDSRQYQRPVGRLPISKAAYMR